MAPQRTGFWRSAEGREGNGHVELPALFPECTRGSPRRIPGGVLDLLLEAGAGRVRGKVVVGRAGRTRAEEDLDAVIAEDGALMKGTTIGTAATGNDNTEEKFNIMVAPGSTVDATFRWTNEEHYADTDGSRLPVAWPNGLNLKEGDFWSGSPYLGESGVLNAGILTKTQCGEYYHVAHSHDLTQATNYGITFGGMLTLIKVEPPLDVQTQMQMDCG